MHPAKSGFDYHRRYYRGENRRQRIRPGLTPCVRRHYETAIAPLQLPRRARVLELGCGLGRFTRLLLADGFRVVATDLSAELVGVLERECAEAPNLEVAACPAEAVADTVDGPFDAVVGFFFLHHVVDFSRLFHGLSGLLRPGGQLSFCEPNAFTPLLYLQIALTPGMSFAGEPSVAKMRPGAVFPALEAAGFSSPQSDTYGWLPPLLANNRWGGTLERGLEAAPGLRGMRAYRTFRARHAG